MIRTLLSRTSVPGMKPGGPRRWGCLVLLLHMVVPSAVHAQFIYITNSGSITITGYTGASGAVVIPSVINGLAVTSIGEEAFFECAGVTNLTIPGSVGSIGAFAFAGCNGLTNVAIPEGVTNIASYAFQACNALATFTLPGSLTSIPANAFAGSTRLKTITVDALNPAYSSVEGVLFDKNQTTILVYGGGRAGGYTVPDGVTTIGDDAFQSCAALINVTLPASVLSISNDAFQNCTALRLVVMSTNVTSLGDEAFGECSALAGIALPDSVTNLGLFAFENCTALTNLTIPARLTHIGSGAFQNCARLAAITVDALNPAYSSEDGVWFDKNRALLLQCPGGKTGDYRIPDGVGSIGDNAFMQCAGLTAVTIPHSVTNIGGAAFFGCAGLTQATVPQGVATIGSGAFQNCARLTSVGIPESVTSIGAGAFTGGTNLTTITVDARNPAYRSLGGVLFDRGQTMLIQCPARAEGRYSVPGSVTNLGTFAFQNCAGLTNVIIPASVTSIGDSAFQACAGLTQLVIPAGVTSIGNFVFQGCNSLTNVSLPGSVTTIGQFAFQNCARLTQLTIPNCVTSIAQEAFADCVGLRRVTIGGGVTNLGNEVFGGCAGLTAIAVDPQNSAYASLGGVLFNKHLTMLIQCPASQTGGYAVPGPVTSIGAEAFQNCAGLTTVTLPAGLTNLGSGAFSGCSRLAGAYFCGNAPSAASATALRLPILPVAPVLKPAVAAPVIVLPVAPALLGSLPVFNGDNDATVYYLPGTTGWGATFGGRPTAPWHSLSLSGSPSFGSVAAGASTFEVLTISNTTSSTLTVSNILCPGGFTADWQAGTIPPGGAQSVEITFRPPGWGYYAGTIAVLSDDADGSLQIAISGDGEGTRFLPASRWVQSLTFRLEAWSQDSDKPTAIANRDLISALSGTTLAGSGTLPSFGSGAKLLTEQGLGSSDVRVVVRQALGRGTADYDVTSAFTPPATNPNPPAMAYVKGGLTNYHAISTFAFTTTSGLSFVVAGLTSASDILVAKTNYLTRSLSGTVAGSGEVGGQPCLIGGTVSLSGGHLE